MHPIEKQLFDLISNTFAANGASPSDLQVKAAMKWAITSTDELFWPMLYFSLLEPGRTVASAYRGIRVFVQLSKPIPGTIQYLTDSAPLIPTMLDHDVGWGRPGQALDEREQIEMLRVVYTSIAGGLPSHHARLELLSALEDEAPCAVCEIWDLFTDFPNAAAIEAACRMAQR